MSHTYEDRKDFALNAKHIASELANRMVALYWERDETSTYHYEAAHQTFAELADKMGYHITNINTLRSISLEIHQNDEQRNPPRTSTNQPDQLPRGAGRPWGV